MRRTTLGLVIGCLMTLQACASAGSSPCGPDVAWIDRVEGGRAVLVGPEQRTQVVPVASLPEGAGEGQALADGRLAPACTRWMRAEVQRRRERLLRREARAPP